MFEVKTCPCFRTKGFCGRLSIFYFYFLVLHATVSFAFSKMIFISASDLQILVCWEFVFVWDHLKMDTISMPMISVLRLRLSVSNLTARIKRGCVALHLDGKNEFFHVWKTSWSAEFELESSVQQHVGERERESTMGCILGVEFKARSSKTKEQEREREKECHHLVRHWSISSGLVEFWRHWWLLTWHRNHKSVATKKEKWTCSLVARFSLAEILSFDLSDLFSCVQSFRKKRLAKMVIAIVTSSVGQQAPAELKTGTLTLWNEMKKNRIFTTKWPPLVKENWCYMKFRGGIWELRAKTKAGFPWAIKSGSCQTQFLLSGQKND